MIRLCDTLRSAAQPDLTTAVVIILRESHHPVHIPGVLHLAAYRLVGLLPVLARLVKIQGIETPVDRRLITVDIIGGTARGLRLHARPAITPRETRAEMIIEHFIRADRGPEKIPHVTFDPFAGFLLDVAPKRLHPDTDAA